ncbi:hypothetical protein Tco_0733139 [Tanacetum coccineum]
MEVTTEEVKEQEYVTLNKNARYCSQMVQSGSSILDLMDELVKVCSFMLCDLDFEPLSLSLSSMPSCDLVSLTNILILCLILKASNQS